MLDAAAMADDPAGDPGHDVHTLTRFESAEELETYLVTDALERYAGLFGQPAYSWWPWYGGYWRNDFLTLDGGPVPAAEPGHSETNTQVAGVDEGDIVETDGNFLYVLSGQELVIMDAWPMEELGVASRVSFDGQPFAEYLNGNRLTVLSHEYIPYDVGPIDPIILGGPVGFAPVGMPYYYPNQPVVTVSVFDVTDRDAPELVTETDVDGSYVDSRAIGNLVYLVLRDDFFLPAPERILVPGDPAIGIDGGISGGTSDLDAGLVAPDIGYLLPGEQYVYETEEQYITRIEGQVLDLALPQYTGYDTAGEPVESGLLSEATDVYHPLRPEHVNLISVAVFDTAADDPGPVSATSVPTDYASEIYVSLGSLYLLQTGWWGSPETSIVKFDLDGTDVNLAATGVVPGRVLNQFSADEYDYGDEFGTCFRIATTDGWASWDGRRVSANNVYVLQQDGEALKIIGSLQEDLAPGEQIYSARFTGDRAFVVTFRRVDPLFAIDLSNPVAPVVTGELKVPGFSNYLHAVGPDFLIGLGRGADEITGLFQDPQVSLFYVGSGDPELVDRFTIETGRAGGLGIFDDHHAISYFGEHHILAISVPAYGHDDWLSRYRYRNDLWVFKIDTGTGGDDGNIAGDVQLLGRIAHDTSVRRSVQIDDLLYSISDNVVTVHDIFDPQETIAKLVYGATILDSTDDVTVDGVDLSAGEHWYQFRTDRQGVLAVAATGSGAIELDLYSGSGQLLERSDGQSMRRPVDADQTYLVALRGSLDENGQTPADAGTAAMTMTVTSATVTGRHVFYNNSTFDGDDANAGAGDDNAVAPDKTALLPGHAAAFENYTSYASGINGVMVDLEGLPDGMVPAAEDFDFRIGNDDDPSGWTALTAEPAVTFRTGAGVDDSDRVTFVWPDGLIRNAWLEVTVKGDNLGLAEDDVFYLGNAVAESGNSAGDARVSVADLLLARSNPRGFLLPAEIDSLYDYNRDARVDATDVLLARNNQTNFLDALKLIDPWGVDGEVLQSPPLADLAWLSEAGVDRPGGATGISERQGTEAALDVILATQFE